MNKFAAAFAILSGTILWNVASGAQQTSDCGAAGGFATLIETVRDRTTRVPLSGAEVKADWLGGDHVRVRTDSAGRARICAPREHMITLRISYHDIPTPPQATLLRHAGINEHTFALDAPSVFLRGTVLEKETGAAIHNVAVQLAHTPLIAFTDAQGRFYFERVPIGDYTLHIEHISYGKIAAPLNVRDEDLHAAVRLTPVAIPLEPIVVTAFSRRLDRAGFYDRERRGIGTFLGRKQIDAMNVQRASDLLRRVPSARIIPQVARRNVPPNVTLGRGNCRYKFIVDGARTLADFEMDFIASYAIEGVEVYNGLAEVPVLFKAIATPESGSPLCGVIAIWTRDGR